MTALLRQPAIVLDVSDLVASAAFWGQLLGVQPGSPRSGGAYLTVGAVDGGPLLVLQHVGEPKTAKNRMHLDFTVQDVPAAVAAVERLGGRLVAGPRPGGGVTLADLDDNEFCIAAFTRNAAGERIESVT